jgi:hypothetical protein
MITLARNHAMSEALLLSGDEDLRVGVQQAQEFGVRVHLLGIRPGRGSQSLFLLQEADSAHEWSPEDLAPFLSCKPENAVVPAVAPVVAAPAAPEPLAEKATVASGVPPPVVAQRPEPLLVPDPLVNVASALAREIPAAELEALTESIRQSGQIPREFDGRLLAAGGRALRVRLDPAQKKEVRNAFLKACEQRLAQRSRDESS